MSHRRRAARGLARFAIVSLLIATAACSASPTESQAQGRDGACTLRDTNAVTVVIDFADLGREPFVGCAFSLPEHATGADALGALGLSVTTVATAPQFICRLDNLPAPDQKVPIPGKESYTEACRNTPPQAAYWSYWYANPDTTASPTASSPPDWVYAIQGYAHHEVVFGGYEGYSFSHNLPKSEPPTMPGP